MTTPESWDTETTKLWAQVTKLHHKPTGQHYLSENYWRKTSIFLLYVSYHLMKALEDTKWWNHLNKKAQVLEVFIPWQDSWELNKKILTKFSVFTQDTYIPWICLVCSLFANSHKDTRQFNLQRNQHKPVITSSASMMPSSRQVFPYGNAI